jgi:hypothetical protein
VRFIQVRPTAGLRTYAVTAAVLAAIVSPLLAIAWLATPDGAEDLVGSVATWAEPARDLAGGLVTFASPDRVYATYVQVLMLLFPAILLTALTAYKLRPSRRFETIAWRTTLTGYVLFFAGGTAVALMLIGGDTGFALVDFAFLALMIPGMLISLIGSTMLGASLLRGGYLPRLTAWILALSFPLMILGSVVLGHNSLGILPWFVAWAATARSWKFQPAGVTSPAGPRPAATT